MKTKTLTLTPFLVALAAALAPALGHAADTPAVTRGVVGVVFTGGGDKLAGVQYESGSSQTIHAGGSAYFLAGVEFTPAASPLTFLGTIGYHYDKTAASNGEVRFQRFPLELLALVKPSTQVRLGGGLRYDTDVKLTSSGAAANLGETSFKSAAGLVLQGEYLVTPAIGITLRAVSIKYRTDGGSSYDGSHIGLGANLYF